MHYRGRLWATRRHIWVDRVACAWLIQRFIDPSARFLWLETPAECPADALGFDFDGATFTHVADRVSFEVLLASFGLDENRGLVRLGAMVHVLDVGGAAAPPTSSTCTIAPRRTRPRFSSRPKLASRTSNDTLSATCVKVAPSKSKPRASAGHSAGVSSHRKRADGSMKRWISHAQATRSTQIWRRVAQRRPR